MCVCAFVYARDNAPAFFYEANITPCLLLLSFLQKLDLTKTKANLFPFVVIYLISIPCQIVSIHLTSFMKTGVLVGPTGTGLIIQIHKNATSMVIERMKFELYHDK